VFILGTNIHCNISGGFPEPTTVDGIKGLRDVNLKTIISRLKKLEMCSLFFSVYGLGTLNLRTTRSDVTLDCTDCTIQTLQENALQITGSKEKYKHYRHI
jgi:hypothetical protein